MIQLEQLLRCKEEEEVGREPEAAARVKVERWRSVGLRDGEAWVCLQQKSVLAGYFCTTMSAGQDLG